MRARGEEPGVADEDTLLSAAEQEESGEAVAAQDRRNRQKERAFVKTVAKAGNKGDIETESDSEKGKEKGKRSGMEYKGVVKAPAKPASKGRARQTKEIPVVLDSSSDSEPERRASASRHTSVQKSTIYTTFQGRLDPIRRHIQSLMLIRDGCPLKTGSTYKTLNYKLVLQAARQVLPRRKPTSSKP